MSEAWIAVKLVISVCEVLLRMLCIPVALEICVYVLLYVTTGKTIAPAHEEAMESGSSSASAVHWQGGSMATQNLSQLGEQQTEQQQTLHTGDTSIAEAKVYTYDNISEEARKEVDCSPVHQQPHGVHCKTNKASPTVKLQKKDARAAAEEDSGEVQKANVCRTVPHPLGTGEVTKAFEGRRVTVMNGQIEPFAVLCFRWERIETGVKPLDKVSLALHQMDIGINTCSTQQCFSLDPSCDNNISLDLPWDGSSNLPFIFKAIIRLEPKPWADKRPYLEPRLIAQKFGRQRNSTTGFQLPIGKPQQAAVTFQSGNNISTSLAAFQWAPPKTKGGNSVVFTWELGTWNDGTTFKIGKWKFFGKPKLPSGLEPRHTQLDEGSDSFIGKATWENLLVNEKALEGQQLEWDLEVRLHVAVLKRKFLGVVYSISEVEALTFKEPISFEELIF